MGDLLARGLAARRAGRWHEARAALAAVVAEGESAPALEGLGEVLWWLGEPQASLAHRQRAYVAHRQARDRAGAGRAALGLCNLQAASFGNLAVAGGWLGRAERIVHDLGRHPLQGWVWLFRGHLAAAPGLGREPIRWALGAARAGGDVDLELAALAALGGKLVAAGELEEGFRLLDEAMTGAFGGECEGFAPLVMASCEMLEACELAGDLERAAQWVQVVEGFTARYGSPYLSASCRMRYGSLLVAKGHWHRAEPELSIAVRLAAGGGPSQEAQALARLAELRLVQGRPEEAEALLAGVEDEAATGLALARVRRARGEDVAALLQRCEARAAAPASQAATLALLVDAHLSASQLGPASTVAGRLSALAAAGPAPGVAALAAAAAGRVAAAQGDAGRAAAELGRALGLFSGLDLPLETAGARLELARVHAAAGDAVAAVAEARRALDAFDRLGAAADADEAAALLRSLGAAGRARPRAAGALTRREEEVLHLVGLGLSNPEIAERLYISRKTAAHHVSNVLAKLGLRNRGEAAAHALRRGPEHGHVVPVDAMHTLPRDRPPPATQPAGLPPSRLTAEFGDRGGWG